MKAIVFPGQGSQKVGMGLDFFENFTEAKEVFQEVDNSLNLKLSNIIFNGEKAELDSTENTQPALMATSIAMLKTLEKQLGKNIESLCSFSLGHSLGEYSALCASSALSLADTSKILKIRGDSFKREGEKQGGAMAALIGVDIETAEKIAKLAAGDNEICQIANDNSIGQIVISGTVKAIDNSLTIAKELGARKAVKLPVSGAFHSHLIAKAKEDLTEGFSNITINKPIIPIIANVTADIVENSSQIKTLLIEQVTSRVRWVESIQKLKSLGVTDIIEIGSGNVLTGLIKRIDKEITCHNLGKIEDLEDINNLL